MYFPTEVLNFCAESREVYGAGHFCLLVPGSEVIKLN